MNKRIGAVLCTVTAMGVVLAVPTTAQAADPYAQGFSTLTENEKVIVFFNSLDRPKNLKVILRRKGGTAPVATLTSFTERINEEDVCEPSCGDILPHPLEASVPKLPLLGEYSVDVQYTGTMGETILHKDRATLNYRLRPYFENVKAANGVSLAAPDTKVSGDVKLYDPRTNTSKPFTGAFTARTGKVTTPLVADAQGHFASKVTVSGAENGGGPDYDNTFVHLTATVDGVKDEEAVPVPVTAVYARIALDAAKVTGPFGTLGDVSGTVTWESPDGTWKPVPAGATIYAAGKYVATDDAGRFTAAGQFYDDKPWKAEGNTPWLQVNSATVAVDTTAGTSFAGLRATVDARKLVKAQVWFNRGEIPAGVTSLKVDVQTSTDGTTGWTTRQRIDVATEIGYNGSAFLEPTLLNPGTGFVRLRYVGTPAIHGSETPALKIPQRTETAIPAFNASPEPARKGKPITVTGKLDQGGPAWKPFGGQLVRCYFRPAGATAWKAMGEAKTAADGTFTKTFTADRTGSWKARYVAADATHFVSPYSRVDEVVVTP
ncbi:hypothetical protein [Streptomyces sp. NPDC002082]|uniref:hypothetical protein n=1 Tax=Streptomyces sp. NPDC002082 TaxID=3154772 RepID=UPI00331F0C6D